MHKNTIMTILVALVIVLSVAMLAGLMILAYKEPTTFIVLFLYSLGIIIWNALIGAIRIVANQK